jgi:hypothetical protein
MELDNLKNTWKDSSTNASTPKNTIMELTQKKSYGPISTLQESFRRQVIIIPVLFVILIVQSVARPELRTDPFFGLFIGMIILMTIFFASAFLILNNMNNPESPVAHQLKHQLNSLNRMLLCYRVVAFTAVIMLAIFLEYFSNEGTALLIQEWYDVELWLRIFAYIALGVISLFIGKLRFEQEYGRHLAEVRRRVTEME